MSPEQVQKSIKQMKDMFLVVAILQLLGFLVGIGSCIAVTNQGGSYAGGIALIVCAILALGFSDASRALKIPNPKAYSKAFQASIVLLIGFPIFTFFGISYLNKLSKTEMKQAFGKA